MKKLDTSLMCEVKDSADNSVVATMRKQGSTDVAIMTHRDGYTIIKSIDPLTPEHCVRHVSVSHWGEATSPETAEAFAKAIFPDVKKWEAMQTAPSSVMHVWEVMV